MGATIRLVLPLEEVRRLGDRCAGGTAAMLSKLMVLGYLVRRGVCVGTEGYRRFVDRSDIRERIAMELGRKALLSMQKR